MRLLLLESLNVQLEKFAKIAASVDTGALGPRLDQ